MYEHHTDVLLPRELFFQRVARHVTIGVTILVVVLGIGIAGYMGFAHFKLIDAFLNAAMILGGMGPVGDLPNDTAKFFAGCYALFAGLVFIGVVSVMIAPFAHRILHTLHLQETSDERE
jgi:hypothetical protein